MRRAPSSKHTPQKSRGCVKIGTSSLFAQSPDFLKPGLCYVVKFLYLYNIKINVMQRYHFRPYSPNQTILFPQRIDKDIAENDPVRLISSIVEKLELSNFRRLYKERGRSPYDPRIMGTGF